MVKKICFCDFVNDGHHWFYNTTLMRYFSTSNSVHYFTSNLNNFNSRELKESSIIYKSIKMSKRSRVFGNIINFVNLVKLIKYCKDENIKQVFLLYFDNIILQFYVLYYLFKLNDISCCVTLHWYPNNKIKEFLLKKILRECKIKVIVHTDDVHNKIQYLYENKKVIKINYPIMAKELIDKEEAKIKLKKNINNNLTLLYFGGTRYDKGLDILLESLKYIDLQLQLNLIIAGKEETFKKEFIDLYKLKYDNITIFDDLKYIDDDDIKYYFSLSDIIILPYRNIFNGESGIFTEGMSFGKVMIAPDIIHFPQIINKYNNGVVYECENSKDLGEKISLIANNINFYRSNSLKVREIHNNEHSIENFVLSYYNTMR